MDMVQLIGLVLGAAVLSLIVSVVAAFFFPSPSLEPGDPLYTRAVRSLTEVRSVLTNVRLGDIGVEQYVDQTREMLVLTERDLDRIQERTRDVFDRESSRATVIQIVWGFAISLVFFVLGLVACAWVD